MSRQRGVALPIALALLLILTLLLAQGIGGAAGEAALAASHQFRHAAFDAAEGGLAAGLQRLATYEGPLMPPPLVRAVDGSAVERSTTEFIHRGAGAPLSGYSVDRFALELLELRSTGEAARGARVVLVAGVQRLTPLRANRAGSTP